MCTAQLLRLLAAHHIVFWDNYGVLLLDGLRDLWCAVLLRQNMREIKQRSGGAASWQRCASCTKSHTAPVKAAEVAKHQ